METFIKTLKRIGKSSLGLIIPNDYVRSMKLSVGGLVRVSIKDVTDNVCSYVCEECKQKFASCDVKPFCPKCGGYSKLKTLQDTF